MLIRTKKTRRKTENLNELNVFISLSDRDKKYVYELDKHLNLNTKINSWNYTKLEITDEFDNIIKSNIQKSNIYILFLSVDFFNSEYIKKNELPIIQKRVSAGKAKIIPIFIGPYYSDKYSELARNQSINSPGNYISKMRLNKRNEIFSKLSKEIINL